jgi:AbrB family looped-hinge helix DNA binding protein
MNMTIKTKDNKSTAIIKMTRSGQITLPVEVRKMFALKEGDYLEAGVMDGKIQLEPLIKVNREEAERQLSEILSLVKYTGPEPVPSVDELSGDIADIIHDMRRENAEGGAR